MFQKPHFPIHGCLKCVNPVWGGLKQGKEEMINFIYLSSHTDNFGFQGTSV